MKNCLFSSFVAAALIVLLCMGAHAGFRERLRRYKQKDLKLNFPTRYYVVGRLELPTNPTIESFQLWHDRSLNKSRVKFYNGITDEFYSPFNGTFLQYTIHWGHNENGVEEQQCHKDFAKFRPKGIPYTESFNFQFVENMQCPMMMKHNSNSLPSPSLDVDQCEKWKSNRNGYSYELHVRRDDNGFTVPLYLNYYGIGEFVSLGTEANWIIYYDYFDYVKDFSTSMFDVHTVYDFGKNDENCTSDMPHANPITAILNPNHTSAHIVRKFVLFEQQFGKRYSSEQERANRMSIFGGNLLQIESHNRRITTWKKAVNRFSDLTKKEMRKATGCVLQHERIAFNDSSDYGSFQSVSKQKLSSINFPERFDWRERNAVSPVKDQMGCGSCWAFSTAGSLEGSYVAQTAKPLVELSVQQLIDCSPKDDGCYGGVQDLTLDFVRQSGGINTVQDYGLYLNKENKCQGQIKGNLIKVKKVVKSNGKINDLKKLIYQYGPVSVSLLADYIQDYTSGILSDPRCANLSANQLTHAVLAVGWGSEQTQEGVLDYWLIKNSWGPSYGEDGYIRIDTRRDCGVALDGSVPIIDV